jgi:ribokinase
MIIVVGSLNHDTTARVSRLPVPGETVMGTGHFTDTGGKGANQAVAAARLGAPVAMVGRVGDDAAGAGLLEALDDAGVNRDGVRVDAAVPTGAAFITVDDEGENTIVVSPGANAAMVPSDLDDVGLEDAAVVLAQLEVPMPVVQAAAERANGLFVLNPAPAAVLSRTILDRVDVLVPNRTELSLLTQSHGDSLDALAEASVGIGVRTVVVTLGARGALVVDGGHTHHVPAPVIEAVDPTAAGDAFCAALAVMLSEGQSVVEAVEFAVKAGAVAATRPGAQGSLPFRNEL